MISPDQVSLVSDVWSRANSIIVVVPKHPSLDQLAAAASLVLLAEVVGKQISFVTPDLDQVDHLQIVGIDRLTTKLGNKQLQVSFPYQPEQVDKVSYHIDEESQRFNLVIQPQKGQLPLSTDQVLFEYTGAEADLIILVGVKSLEELDHLYQGYEQLYQDATTIALNTYEAAHSAIKLDATGFSCLSEATAWLISVLNLNLEGDGATNLLFGIETTTDQFRSYATTADTFEWVSKLMRAGARRLPPPHQPKEKPLSIDLKSGAVLGQLPSSSGGNDSFAQMLRKSATPAPSVTSALQPKKPLKKKVVKPEVVPGNLNYTPSESRG